jgi:hypothetical protein
VLFGRTGRRRILAARDRGLDFQLAAAPVAGNCPVVRGRGRPLIRPSKMKLLAPVAVTRRPKPVRLSSRISA